MNKTVKRNVGNAFIYVILIAVSITMLFPFLWMISTSLKSKMDAQVFPPQWIPNPIITDAYVDVWKVAPLLSGMGNSLLLPFRYCSSERSARLWRPLPLPRWIYRNGIFCSWGCSAL